MEPAVAFDRDVGDHEHVCATVYLPLGITLELWSDEVAAERRWEVEELSLNPGDGRPAIPLTGHRSKLLDCELIAHVRREWDREVAREARQAAGARGQEALDV